MNEWSKSNINNISGWYKLLLLGIFFGYISVLWAKTPLTADEAFKLSVSRAKGQPNVLNIQWEIAPSYNLYDEIFVSSNPTKTLRLGEVRKITSPATIEIAGKSYKVFKVHCQLMVPYEGVTPGVAKLKLNYQGCSDLGYCYPPIEKSYQVVIDESFAIADIRPISNENNSKAGLLEYWRDYFDENRNPFLVAGSFLILGFLMSLTPCVLPMIPILSGIIVGNRKDLSTKHGLKLSLIYVISMSSTYALVGVFMGYLGGQVQSFFQQSWLIVLMSLFYMFLAISMFGWFEFPIFNALKSGILQIQQKLTGGVGINVAVLGILSTLIISPCISPPLMGVLSYIGYTGDGYLGGLALFSLGMGMGAPLLVVGTSLGKWFPKSGSWLVITNKILGILLLSVALILLIRVLPLNWESYIWYLFIVVIGICLGAFEKKVDQKSIWKFSKWFGRLLILVSLIGFLGKFLLSRHFNNLIFNKQIRLEQFYSVTTRDQLLKYLKKARFQSKPVLIEYYADWCVYCRSFNKEVLTNSYVQKLLKNWVVLQVNVTNLNKESEKMLAYFSVIAPPTYLFIDKNGNETAKRNYGQLSSNALSNKLKTLYENINYADNKKLGY